MKPGTHYSRILAIDPSTKGFGFAVLEGRGRLVDWGVAVVWAKSDKEFMARVECMIERYDPDSIVLEEARERQRSERRRRRINLINGYARTNKIQVIRVSKVAVRAAFEGRGQTKHEIAVAITATYPELKPHLPPPRKPWMSEDDRMNIFDAVALLLAAVKPS